MDFKKFIKIHVRSDVSNLVCRMNNNTDILIEGESRIWYSVSDFLARKLIEHDEYVLRFSEDFSLWGMKISESKEVSDDTSLNKIYYEDIYGHLVHTK